jgi:hypothetical protein
MQSKKARVWAEAVKVKASAMRVVINFILMFLYQIEAQSGYGLGTTIFAIQKKNGAMF